MSDRASFTLFSQLPTELRLDIWRLSCHQRVVEVSYDHDNDQCTSTASPPAVLHACHESRCEALKIYKMSFGTRSHQPQIYFCPYLDTLYLPRPPFMGYDDDSRSFRQLVTDTEDIANLALDHVRPAIRRPWETYNKYALMQSFSKVHEVYLILSSERMEDQEPHGSLSLADPAGDVLDLCRLLSDVKESFAYEVGASYKADKEQELLFAQPTLPDLVLKAKVMPGVEGYGMHVSAAA